MERPKHRRLTFAALVLLAAGSIVSWMLVHQRQSSMADRPTAPPSVATLPSAAPEPHQQETPSVAATSSSVATAPASPSPTTTGTLRGRLIDAATRQPVKEFAVSMLRVQRGPEWHQEEPLTQAFQSEAGRFSWKEVPADTWRVTVSAHGYLQFDLGEVTIAAGKATREAVMPLLHGYSLRGRVFAASTGAAVPGATIAFRVAAAWPDGRETPPTKSQEDGTFELDGVPGGEIKLMAYAQGYAPAEAEAVVDEKTPPQEFALSVGGRIAGVLRTESGAPIEGYVGLGGIVMGGGNAGSAEFSFDHLPAGHYKIVASTAVGSATQETDLGQNERKEDIVFVIHAGRSVRGTIRGLRPEQLTGTHVMLASGAVYLRAQPDEHGAYVITGAPPGQARLAVYAADRQVYRKVEVPVDQDLALDIVFPSGARLSGRVTQDGKPATTRMVWMAPGDSKDEWRYHSRTAPDGSYEIEGLPLGEYRVRAEEDISRPITIAGDAVFNIDIPSVQLAGRVVEDGSAIPIVHADVYVRGIDSATARVHAYKATNDFGEFSMTGVEPGAIMLIVYLAGYELYQEKLSYSAPITNKTIALRKSSGVEVRVHRVKQTQEREFARGFMVTDTIPGAEWQIDLWIPLNREGVGSMPSALAGSKLAIQSLNGKPIVIEEWDGLPLELQL